MILYDICLCLTYFIHYENLLNPSSAANDIISFFFMAEYDSIVCMYHIFIHGPVGGFRVLAIVNNAAVNMGVLVPTQIMVFFRYMARWSIF